MYFDFKRKMFLLTMSLFSFSAFYTNLMADDDICYNDPVGSQYQSTPPVYMCSDTLSINCNTTTPIKNNSDENLTDIEIYLTSDGILNGAVFEDVGVEEGKGEANSSSGIEAGPMSGLGSNITYSLVDMEPDDVIETWKASLAEIDMTDSTWYAKYTKDGEEYITEIYPCDSTTGASSDTGNYASFDAWDTDKNIDDRNITTKISSQYFELELVGINDENTNTEAKNVGTIKYRLYDINNNINITDWEDFDTSNATVTKGFTVMPAYKNVKVQFQYCANRFNHSLTTYDKCDPEEEFPYELEQSFSSDNFAIRPYGFRIFTKNEYKRAGEDFNATIKALNQADYYLNSGSIDNTSGVINYNESVGNLLIQDYFYTPTSAEITQMQSDTGKTDVSTCPNVGTFYISNTNFINGEINSVLNYSETGILGFNVSEKNDASQFAYVDIDDTPDAARFIQPANALYDRTDINKTNILLFIPYQFDVTAEYNTTTQTPWIYMSNDVNKSNSSGTTPDIAAYIKYNIVAKNKTGNKLLNYTATCFPDIDEVNAPRVNGLKLNTTFDLNLDFVLESDRAQTISLYSENNTSVALWTPIKDVNMTAGANPVTEWISQYQFLNGEGEAKVYFNINREVNKAKNPNKILLRETNTSTSWMTNSGATNIFNGIDKNATIKFYYGRTHATRQRYVSDTGSVPIYFEVYCYGSSCDKTLLADGENSTRTNDIRWYINTQHDVSKHGISGNITEGMGGDAVSSNTPTAATPSVATLTYDTTKGYGHPYRTDMENNASSWLIYSDSDASATKNGFSVEFEGGNSGWSGAHETDVTTKDHNMTHKTNRRSMW